MKKRNTGKKGKVQYVVAAVILLIAAGVSVVILSNPKKSDPTSETETISEATMAEETEMSMIVTEYYDKDPEDETKPSDCTVKFYGFDRQVVQTETVPYGKPVKVPTLQTDGYVFKGWDQKLFVVTNNMDVYALGEELGDAANIVYSNAVYAETDKTIQIPVMLGGTVNCCAFTVQIKYDSQLLTFKNAKQTIRGLKVDNDKENGVITLTYFASSNLQEPTEIAKLQFECTQDGEYSTNFPIATTEIYALQNGKKEYTDSVAYDGALYLFKY